MAAANKRPAPDAPAPETLEDRVAKLEAELVTLREIARLNGWTGA